MSRERELLGQAYAVLQVFAPEYGPLLADIKDELATPLPDPVGRDFDEKMLQHFTCEKVVQNFEGVSEPFILYHTKMGAHPTYQLYKNEAAALWHNLGKALGYAEPPARKSLSDDERTRLETLERICAGVSQDMIDGGFTVKELSEYAKSLEDKLRTKS